MTTGRFPKYHELVCNTYDTGFIASTENCVLQSGNTTRARLATGGTFFRSVDNGAVSNVNNIILECIVSPPVGDVEEVVFKITDPDGATRTLTFTQEFDGTGPTCVKNGVTQLRDKLVNGSPPYVVIMPPLDDIQPWDSTTDDASCLLTSFGPFAMGSGSPVADILPDASPSLRTGPAFTLFHVQEAETGDKGERTTINAISEWNGTAWVLHPSELFAAGSGSPALCQVGSP